MPERRVRPHRQLAMILLMVLLAAFLTLAAQVMGKQYSPGYTFLADRTQCDGQCTYCRHSHNHHLWGNIRQTITGFIYQDVPGLSSSSSFPPLTPAQYGEIQRLIDWSWKKDVHYECILGIIALRLLAYGFSNPFDFMEGSDPRVLDFLDTFNANTGALDLLTSSWSAILAGGWPVFRGFLHVSRKVKDRIIDEDTYPSLASRGNECDALDSPEDASYRGDLLRALRGGEWPFPGLHLTAIRRGLKCPIGGATALAFLALDVVRHQHSYHGSMKDGRNFVHGIMSTVQDVVMVWASTKPNWAPFFDLLTSEWPLWEVLSELACVDSGTDCVTRSSLQCYDYVRRQMVPCPHALPRKQRTFVSCGEHDVCTWPQELDMREWCVPYDRRPQNPPEPWLLTLSHDHEARICTQCGQDGILRTIFDHIGFRDATGLLPPYFVEFGARKPGMLNSAVVRQFCSWDGLLMDSQPGETPHGGCRTCPGVAELVRTEFVTAENVADLFEKHSVPKDFDLLTIDTDYNDYWIWRALLGDGRFRPRVVALDFNPDHPIDSAKVVKYIPDAEWDGTIYTVGSLLAYALMARHYGYSFAYALEMGSHAFFIREDLLAESDRELPLRSVKKMSHPPDPLNRQFVDVLYDFRPRSVNASGGASLPETCGAQNLGCGVDDELSALRVAVAELTKEIQALRRSS